MAKKNINIGLSVNDKTGDTLRSAFDKINQNFTELYTLTGGTAADLQELAQDYAAPLFNHASHVNITATYDDANNKILLTGTPAQVQTDWNASSGLGVVLNKPTIPSAYTLPTASSSVLGGIKIGTGLSIDVNGVVTASSGSVSSLVNGSHTLSLGSTGNTTFPTGLTLGAPRGPNTVNFTTAIDKSFQIETGTSTTSKLWSFGTDGGLTLPASGDVVDSTSVSQLARRVEGSWTVTNGTSTYSFTVPMDGTYTMWVKGNIPNGIITWNATLSISNTNVPAIGTQYAWNYTGGGSPILLTAIPNQIRGSAGTISTDNTYAGTTSNRFDFGISNTSGANQTIYYGYIRI